MVGHHLVYERRRRQISSLERNFRAVGNNLNQQTCYAGSWAAGVSCRAVSVDVVEGGQCGAEGAADFGEVGFVAAFGESFEDPAAHQRRGLFAEFGGHGAEFLDAFGGHPHGVDVAGSGCGRGACGPVLSTATEMTDRALRSPS